MVRRILAAFVAICLLGGSPAWASTFTVEIGGDEFSRNGRTIDDNAVTLEFEDVAGSPGEVKLTVSFNSVGLPTWTRLFQVTFNYDENKTINSITQNSGPGASSIGFGQNQFNSDGDQGYDAELLFKGSGSNRFRQGNMATFTIKGSTDLTAMSFDHVSDPGKKGPFIAAIHISNDGTGNSGHYGNTESITIQAVPEPASLGVWMVLCTVGLVTASRTRRRIRAGQ